MAENGKHLTVPLNSHVQWESRKELVFAIILELVNLYVINRSNFLLPQCVSKKHCTFLEIVNISLKACRVGWGVTGNTRHLIVSSLV